MDWFRSVTLSKRALYVLSFAVYFVVGNGSCGSRTDILSTGEGGSRLVSSGGSTFTATGGVTGGGTSGLIPEQQPRVCVFDYDLTLSSHECPTTTNKAEYHCRQNTCITYNWYSQCLAEGARTAIAECVKRRAYIGIASKATVDLCWQDKVVSIVTEQQFPELTNASNTGLTTPIVYPKIDERANWNCDDCAYTMDAQLSKPDGIRRVMRHYGLNPQSATDRASVIFWDDSTANINDVRSQIPEARAILVPSNTGNGNDGGCGITQKEIDAGFAP